MRPVSRQAHRALPALILAGLGLAGAAAAQSFPSDVATQAALAVVEVEAQSCPGENPNRTGSGFVYLERGQIVTAHHVVGGCRTFRVFFERARPGGVSLSATLTKVYTRTDLALLRVDNAPEVPPLRALDGTLAADAALNAIGFSLGQPTLGNLDVAVSIGASRLQDMLPQSTLDEVRRHTEIDVASAIIRLKSPLLPGMSGGPIINRDGRVVAIVAGGLRAGAAPASWGWPAAHLPRLMAASAPTATQTAAASSSALFSTTKDLTARPVHRCGALDFERVRTAPFATLAATADDQQAVMQVIAISTRPRSEIDGTQFEIWRHTQTGATIVVPSGVNIVQDGGRCVARSASGQFEQVIVGYAAANEPQIQETSTAFENLLLGYFPQYNWTPDMMLSMPAPRVRPDGFVVRRKGAVGVSLTSPKAVHAFETLMARGGTLVGTAILNHGMGGHYPLCLQQPALRGCAGIPAEIGEWTRFVLATQLSTYPVY